MKLIYSFFFSVFDQLFGGCGARQGGSNEQLQMKVSTKANERINEMDHGL